MPKSDRGMGFPNAAIAAYYALEQPGINQRCHFLTGMCISNGTTRNCRNHQKNRVLFAASQSPCYPGTEEQE